MMNNTSFKIQAAGKNLTRAGINTGNQKPIVWKTRRSAEKMAAYLVAECGWKPEQIAIVEVKNA